MIPSGFRSAGAQLHRLIAPALAGAFPHSITSSVRVSIEKWYREIECLRCLEVYDEFELLDIEQDGRNKMLGKWRRLSLDDKRRLHF
jgi:phage baseplate assembly protein W